MRRSRPLRPHRNQPGPACLPGRRSGWRAAATGVKRGAKRQCSSSRRAFGLARCRSMAAGQENAGRRRQLERARDDLHVPHTLDAQEARPGDARVHELGIRNWADASVDQESSARACCSGPLPSSRHRLRLQQLGGISLIRAHGNLERPCRSLYNLARECTRERMPA